MGKRFPNGLEALRDISLEIEAGEFVVLLGPSGCGKSTLLRLIAGLEEASEGTLAWSPAPPRPGEIGFVFQEPTLLPWAGAAENVYLPLRLAGLRRREAMPRVEAMLAALGLAGFAKARPRELSGGMRMRVSLARALVTRPRILLMDEPFAALDEFTRQRLQNDLRRLWREEGLSVVFVTHSLYEAAFLASRVVVLSPRPGRIAAIHTAPPIGAEGEERRTAEAFLEFIRTLGLALRALHLPAEG